MRPRYKILLLDADNTLFDFNRAERHAFFSLLEEAGRTGDEDTYRWYSQLNEEYWERMAAGELSKGQVVLGRFAELADRMGLKEAPEYLNEQFQMHLRQTGFLLPGAQELCRELSVHCTLAIATNGVACTQRERLARSAIAPYITHLIISEEAGAEKPARAYFDYAMKCCGSPELQEVLMVGDSLSTDIKGGMEYGVDTCWFCPSGQETDIPVTYRITMLQQLPPIVLQG